MQIQEPVSEYWERVKKLEDTLPSVVHLMSVERKGDKQHRSGVFVEALPHYAAQHILDGTHRVATAEETKKWEDDTEKAKETRKKEEVDNKSIHIHPANDPAPQHSFKNTVPESNPPLSKPEPVAQSDDKQRQAQLDSLAKARAAKLEKNKAGNEFNDDK